MFRPTTGGDYEMVGMERFGLADAVDGRTRLSPLALGIPFGLALWAPIVLAGLCLIG
jgi:hypothetical protein